MNEVDGGYAVTTSSLLLAVASSSPVRGTER